MTYRERQLRKVIREEIERIDEGSGAVGDWTARERERLERAGFGVHQVPNRDPREDKDYNTQFRDGASLITKSSGCYYEEANAVHACDLDELFRKMKDAGHEFEGNPQI